MVDFFPSLVREEDVYVEYYEANFYPNGLLEEKYTYRINEKRFRMLFRIWEPPLSDEALDTPYVEIVDIEGPAGSIPYFKDYKLKTWVEPPYDGHSKIFGEINSLAMRNEAGCFNQFMFDPGTYSIKYLFKIHPPIEYDENIGHLNLAFANEHLRYDRVKLIFQDSDYINDIFLHL
jgi:hypothetical protein